MNAQKQSQTNDTTIVDFTKSQSAGAQSNGISSQNNTSKSSAIQPTTVTPYKEQEPFPSITKSAEVIQPVEGSVELEPEVEEAGVEIVSQAPIISREEKNLGVQLAKETSTFEKEQEKKKYPLSEVAMQRVLKGNLLFKDASNPILWLALLIYRQIQIEENKKKKEK